MRRFFKRCASFFLVPITQWYLRKERIYFHRGIKVKVYPGVFHPGFFYSTKFLIDYLSTRNLHNQSLLELGCGTGLISIFAAKKGARVTASDISRNAVMNATANAESNHVSVNMITSDLFEGIGPSSFDWIIINPPYYAGVPKNESEQAWYCGPDFEYFRELFKTLGIYTHRDTRTIMVLTLESDLKEIKKIGRENGFEFELLEDRSVLF
ncbi:MAG TPA: methyltransferase, partial [Cyclobacteriaceae bacterium]|nr:methyltransferase [Cyclobacteriaceae bacterium]